jgi:hypothetical protein
MIRMKGFCALAGCNFWAWALAGQGLEEPDVQDVSNVLRDLCEVHRLTL